MFSVSFSVCCKMSLWTSLTDNSALLLLLFVKNWPVHVLVQHEEKGGKELNEAFWSLNCLGLLLQRALTFYLPIWNLLTL